MSPSLGSQAPGTGARLGLAVIRIYQRTLSPDHGGLRRLRHEPFCSHQPTCSDYALVAIERYGLKQGTPLAWKRLRRCGRQDAVWDPVP
jgi:uncharacterized protein